MRLEGDEVSFAGEVRGLDAAIRQFRPYRNPVTAISALQRIQTFTRRCETVPLTDGATGSVAETSQYHVPSNSPISGPRRHIESRGRGTLLGSRKHATWERAVYGGGDYHDRNCEAEAGSRKEGQMRVKE